MYSGCRDQIAKLLKLNPATQAYTYTVSIIVFNNCLGERGEICGYLQIYGILLCEVETKAWVFAS